MLTCYTQGCRNVNTQNWVARYIAGCSGSIVIIAERLRARIDDAGLNQTSLAKRVGVSQASIAKLVSGGGQGSRHLHQIAQELGTTAAYLTGQTDDPASGALPAPTAVSVAEQLNSVLVPYFFNLDHSMGGGAFFDEPPAHEMVPMPKEWLRGRCSGSFDQLMLLPGRGDSMQTTIMDGDVLLVDRAQRVVTEPDRIWAFGYDETGFIKRLSPLKPNRFRITSDNAKAAPPWEALRSDISIVGRVISIMQWK